MLLLAGVLAWHIVDSRREISALRSEIARPAAAAESENAQALSAALEGLTERVTAVEARQKSGSDQEAALQALFQNVANSYNFV